MAVIVAQAETTLEDPPTGMGMYGGDSYGAGGTTDVDNAFASNVKCRVFFSYYDTYWQPYNVDHWYVGINNETDPISIDNYAWELSGGLVPINADGDWGVTSSEFESGSWGQFDTDAGRVYEL